MKCHIYTFIFARRVVLRSGRRFDQHFKYLQQVSSTHFGRRYFPIWGEDTCWRYSGDQIWWRYLFFELKDTSQSLGWPFHSLWGDQRYLKFRIWWRYLNVSYCPKNRDLISDSLKGTTSSLNVLLLSEVCSRPIKPYTFLKGIGSKSLSSKVVKLFWRLRAVPLKRPPPIAAGPAPKRCNIQNSQNQLRTSDISTTKGVTIKNSTDLERAPGAYGECI